MKILFLLSVVLQLCFCYLNSASLPNQIITGKAILNSMKSGTNSNYQSIDQEQVSIYGITTPNISFPPNTIYLSVNYSNLQASNNPNNSLPSYFVTCNYTPGEGVFQIIATVSSYFNPYSIAVNYIIVQKDYPLYFRAFQYFVNANNTQGSINYASILNETERSTQNELKCMYGISGVTFTANPHGKINFQLQIMLRGVNSSWQLSYSVQSNITFVTEAKLFIAIFSTFAVKDQYVYILDVFPMTQTNINNYTLTFNSGVSPVFAGVTSFSEIQIDKSFVYNYEDTGSPLFISNINSTSFVSWKDSLSSSFKTSSNLFLFTKAGCLPFMIENKKDNCTSTCSYTQTKDPNFTMSWRANCSICIHDKVCTKNQFCGDYVVQSPEDCDLGAINGFQDIGCNFNCKVVPGFHCMTTNNLASICRTICGDGVVTFDENCDLGTDNGNATLGCTANCTTFEGFTCNTTDYKSQCHNICGDTKTVGLEDCDFGIQNGQKKYGCTSDCKEMPGFKCVVNNMVSVCKTTCGDGIVNFDEECDLGNMNGKLQQGCTSDCKIVTGFNCKNNVTSICNSICGDRLVVGVETCDLGADLNGKNNSGCSDRCTVVKGFTCNISVTPTVCTSICGDGIVAGTQSCDLGSQFNGNVNEGCSKECSTIAGFICKSDEFQHSTCRTQCGDSLVAGKQKCDLGTLNGNQSGCSRACQVDYGFACSVDQTTRRSVCLPICGDNITITPEEICDTKKGGCTSNCKNQVGFYCTVQNYISTCITHCGDAIKAGAEQCDEGTMNGVVGKPCTSSCLIAAGYYNCSFAPLVCMSQCGDGIKAGSEQCDNGIQNGDSKPCLSNCTLNPNNTICVQTDANSNCTSLTVNSSLSLVSYIKSLEFNSVEIQLKAQYPFVAAGRLLLAIDSDKEYSLPAGITFNFPYVYATVRFPNIYTIKVNVVYNTSLNDLENMTVMVGSYATKLPEVTDNNLAIKCYNDAQYSMTTFFSKLVPALAYLCFSFFVLMVIFSSKIIALQLLFMYQFAHGCLIMFRKMEIAIYPFSSLWIFSGYFYPTEDSSPTDPRVATLGYHSNFLSNFNINIAIYLLPIFVAGVLLLYQKIRKLRSHRLQRVVKQLRQGWQLTAMLFLLQPLLFAFVINLTYGTVKAIGIVIGLVLIAILAFYLYLYYQKSSDTASQRMRFIEYKRSFRAGYHNFCIWLVVYKTVLSLTMVTVSGTIVSQSVLIVLICGWITVLFIKRPYVSKIQLAPFVNNFFILILALFFVYTRSVADLPEINFASYIPIAVLVMLGATFLFNFTYASVYLVKEIRIQKQLQKDRKEKKTLEQSMHPTLQIFQEPNKKQSIQIINLSQTGESEPTEIITVIMERYVDKEGEPSTQVKKESFMPNFEQLSSINKISEKSQHNVSEFLQKILFKNEFSASPNRTFCLDSNEANQSQSPGRKKLPPIQEEPPVSPFKQQ